MSSSYPEEQDDRDLATRGDCVMSTTEALYRLIRNERDKWDEEDEWLIIKVPRKNKNVFYIDYCDGDVEDEFHWLEGPYLPNCLTVEDLLDRRRSQARTTKRRRGEAEFREDEEMDKRDKDGNLLLSFSFDGCGPQPVLCNHCQQELYSDLSVQNPRSSELETSLNEDTPKRTYNLKTTNRKPKRKHKKRSRTALMTREKDHETNAPLHDMSCVGIDTCSARSISCDREDFLHLEITQGINQSEVLRGVGGISGVAGKGVLIFYAKDVDGKVKAIIELKECTWLILRRDSGFWFNKR
jgi:hypothetical protein